MSQDDRRVPRDGWDEQRTRRVPTEDNHTRRIPLRDRDTTQWHSGGARAARDGDPGDDATRRWQGDPDATRIIPVIPAMPVDDAPPSHPPAYGEQYAQPSAGEFARTEEPYGWRPPQEDAEPSRGRTGWIVAVVLLVLAVIVLLALLLGGGGDEQDPAAPADTLAPTEEAPADPEPTDPAPADPTEPADPEPTEDTQDGGVLDELPDVLPSELPTELPEGLPSELPTELPEGLGEDVEQRLRDGLDGVTGLFEGGDSESAP